MPNKALCLIFFQEIPDFKGEIKGKRGDHRDFSEAREKLKGNSLFSPVSIIHLLVWTKSRENFPTQTGVCSI
jgi:hypothetical protein